MRIDQNSSIDKAFIGNVRCRENSGEGSAKGRHGCAECRIATQYQRLMAKTYPT
jgi:hypothetical protein